jgi:pilus assembly protein CpaE
VRAASILVLDRDGDLTEQVRKVSDRLRVEIVACASIADAEELVEQGPFDVLVGGPGTGTRAGLERLARLRDGLPAKSVVLAFAERPESTLRSLVRTGAIDLIRLPVDDDSLRATIEQALEASQEHGARTDALGRTDADRPVGRVFTVASASGGAGKTFYATNLAYFLHARSGARTCVLDLDLQFGEVSIALRLQPRYTISDILERDDGEEAALEKYIDEYLAVHDSGIHVLAAPRSPSDADQVESRHVAAVLEALRTRFDYVIVDTPAALTETVLTALELSDVVHVLVTLDVPSLRNMSTLLRTLEQLNIPSESTRLILNKVERDLGVDGDQLSKLFPQGFMMELPYVREVTKSLNVGTPILAMAPASEISRCMEAALRPLLPDRAHLAAGGRDSRLKGLVSRLFRRPAALPASSS